MTQVLRKVLRFLESARLATWLLVFVGAWSVVATLVPQGDAVGQWASAHPAVEPVVRALDLHHAFSAPIFIGVVAVLAISTMFCAWTRTKIALKRGALLRAARAGKADSHVTKHDLEVQCAPGLESAQALSQAATALEGLGIRTARRGDTLSSVSPWWSVWGSPVFHWGLLALTVVILVGSLQRSEGLMGVAVGQSVPDKPASYGRLHAGPLHNWNRVHDNIRVDAFETDYRTGEIDRGPTPVVSVLDDQGRVLKTQYIFPNSPLQIGSLTIHPSAWGFAVDLTLLDSNGVEYGHTTKLVDVSEEASGGTVPLGAVGISNKAGQQSEQAIVTVPLAREDGHLVVPSDRSARLILLNMQRQVLADSVLKPGESMMLPSGETLRVDAVGFYARLSVVHDSTISFLFAAMLVALLGLTLTLIVRQQSVIVSTHVEPDGSVTLYASMRLWRNVPTNRTEIQAALTHALGPDDKEQES